MIQDSIEYTGSGGNDKTYYFEKQHCKKKKKKDIEIICFVVLS